MLQLCVSQQLNIVPFSFKTTGIRVYSFEEALYHVYHYWRESVDDILSDGMISWVGQMDLPLLATGMNDLKKKSSLVARVLGFLQLVDYFDRDELDQLKVDLQAWEQRNEWEQLKERADSLANHGQPGEALALYKRALNTAESALLLNNMGVAYMQLGAPKDAMRHLTRALALAPENFDILLHYTEAAILSGEYKTAGASLAQAEEQKPDDSGIPFLHGLMAHLKKNHNEALIYFKHAAKLSPEIDCYVYKIADVLCAIHQYDKALAALKRIPKKDAAFHAKEAELHAATGSLPAAINALQQALTFGEAPILLTRLAAYHRQNHDLQKAEATIKKALAIAPDNNPALLESARIKKSLGRTRDYQAALNVLLKGLKEKYRASV